MQAIGSDGVKPPFAYFGGKQTMASRIASSLPPHRHYVEPFAGSLAVLLTKEPSKLETVNDIDGDLMLLWRMLRDRGDDLMAKCAFTPHSREEHQRAYDDTDDDLERARRVWVKLTQGRTGTLRRTGWRFFSNPAGTNYGMPQYLDAYIERMPDVIQRLRGVSLECRPALEVIATYGQHPEVCLYVDPPYEGVTRPRTYDGYRHEMRATDDHQALAEALLTCKASVVLSGYHSPLYDEMYADWDSIEIAAFTGQGRAGEGHRTEVLWSNRPLHDGRLAI
jgi:DNA adenine methylase